MRRSEACTLSVEPGIALRALEAGTGKNVTDSTRGAIGEGIYIDSLRPAESDLMGRETRDSGDVSLCPCWRCGVRIARSNGWV